jgi:hypothetical protein
MAEMLMRVAHRQHTLFQASHDFVDSLRVICQMLRPNWNEHVIESSDNGMAGPGPTTNINIPYWL